MSVRRRTALKSMGRPAANSILNTEDEPKMRNDQIQIVHAGFASEYRARSPE